jgi:simple sugar transport system substrate-binding protein
MRTYDSRTYEGAYMAGVIAGGMTKTNTLGVVGSVPIPEVVRNINSFTMGAQSVNPNVKTKVVWVNKWFDPPNETAAGAIAHQRRRRRADAEHRLVGGAADGGQGGKYAFGWDSDMTAYAPNAHLASAIINWVPYYKKATQDALDGSWKGRRPHLVGRQGRRDRHRLDLREGAGRVKAKVETVKAGPQGRLLLDLEGPITSNDGKEMLAPAAPPTTSSSAASTSSSRASRARSRAPTQEVTGAQAGTSF